jgi:hypothetical protein
LSLSDNNPSFEVSFSQRPSNSHLVDLSRVSSTKLVDRPSAGEQILNKLVKNINNLYFLTKSLVNIPDYEFNEDEQKKAIENEIKNINPLPHKPYGIIQSHSKLSLIFLFYFHNAKRLSCVDFFIY